MDDDSRLEAAALRLKMFLYDIKQGRTLIIAGVLSIIVFCAIAVVGTYAWIKAANPAQTFLSDDGEPAPPLATYGQASFETFGCLARGDQCAQFSDAIASMTTANTEFTYTPLNDTDPGTETANGERQVVLNSDLTDADWQAIGAAVTRDGAIGVEDVNAETLNVDGSVGYFAAPGPDGKSAWRGQMVFEYAGNAEAPQNVSIKSITYEAGDS